MSREAEQLVADAQAVVDAVTLDENGKMIGTIWQGGNGGLLSRDTLKAVDRLRLTLGRLKAKPAPRPSENINGTDMG